MTGRLFVLTTKPPFILQLVKQNISEQRATFVINPEHFLSLRPAWSYKGDIFLIKHGVTWGIKSMINWEIVACNLIIFKDI